jgi:hypothetical protein
VFGDLSRHDDRITRGSFGDGNAIVFYLEDERLVATLQTGQDGETEETLKGLIRAGAQPQDIRVLADESVPIGSAFSADRAVA